MAQKAPGRHEREGLTTREIFEMFPDDGAAEQWFESIVWDEGRFCPHCGSLDTIERKSRKPMPYRCRDCREYFSIRTGTPMHRSKIALRDWAYGIYLHSVSLKGVSSMRLHRELGINQKSAWFMAHRIREAFEPQGRFGGEVEMDEVYMGGLEKNKHESKKLHAGTGGVGKTAVVGVKERQSGNVHAEVVSSVNRDTLHGIIENKTEEGSKVYTDQLHAYRNIPKRDHEAIAHNIGEYVKGRAHTNGIESFWASLRRAHMGTFHKFSPKHLQRYVNEFEAKNNIRDMDTIDQMRHVVRQMPMKRLTYKQLKAPHPDGLSNHAREAAA